MSDVFISYRRDDSAGETRSIRDRLAAVFSRQQVFMDVDAIPVGVDFREYLATSIRKCRVVLVVIGPHWLSAANAQGKRRLDDPGDYVRIEIELALKREAKKDVCLIPVLLNGAAMPPAEKLPQSLRPLAYRNAIDVRHGSFERDVAELVANVQRYVQPAPSEAPGGVAKRTKGLVWAIGGVAAALATVLIATILILNASDGVDPQRAAELLKLRIEDGDLARARDKEKELLDLHPELADAEAFQAVQRMLETAEAEDVRLRKIGPLLERLNKTPPEKIATSDLDELAKLAQTPAEKAQLAGLQDKQKSALNAMREALNLEGRENLKHIESAVEKVRTATTGSRAEVMDSLSMAIEGLSRMEGDARMDAGTAKSAGELLKTARELQSSEKTRVGQTGHEKSITASVGDPQAYWKALMAFAYDYPASEAAADFRRLGPEVAWWETMQKWSEVLARGEFADFRGLKPSEAKSRREKLQDAEKEFGPCPWEEYEGLSKFLLGVSSRVSFTGQPKDQELKAPLGGDWRLHGLWMVEMGGKCFYGSDPPRPGEGPSLRLMVLRKPRAKAEAITIKGKHTYHELAPQCKLAARISSALPADKSEELAQGKWEETFCDLLAAVRAEPKLEPIYAVEIYKEMLRVALPGSAAMEEVYADDREAIERHRVDLSVNWLDPDDPNAPQARLAARQALRDLGNNPAEQRRKTLDLAAQMSKCQLPRFEWVGWLARDDAGAWQAAGKKLPAEGALYVLIADEARSTPERAAARLLPIGRLVRGKAQWDGSVDPRQFVEGRPVYVRSVAGE
jgi:hypothetical protein